MDRLTERRTSPAERAAFPSSRRTSEPVRALFFSLVAVRGLLTDFLVLVSSCQVSSRESRSLRPSTRSSPERPPSPPLLKTRS